MEKRILVNGACGRMGQEVVKTVVNDTKDLLVGACDHVNIGEDIKNLLSLDGEEVIVQKDLQQAIDASEPDVIIDFTTPRIVMDNIKTGLKNGIHMIVGTTGITDVDLKNIDKLAEENNVNCLIVPNFAVGAVLMMRFAAEAAKYLNDVEIIELHHDQKLDAPSGTAIKTAELINENRCQDDSNKVDEIEKLEGARGGDSGGINIHSVRLPGMVAHQEVIFGAEGQSLKIRHDSYNRKSFMPGVRLALDNIYKIEGLVYGLEKVMD
ncbi:MAG: 4-hydroxy-tetrahydrodipicolinate reductase [Halothermotrichaceae bacterium]